MDAFRRASAVLFYSLGVLVLVLYILERKDMLGVATTALLNVLDLPLLLFGMIYGGLSLVSSMSKGSVSTVLFSIITVFLGALFLLFLWLNFGMQVATAVL